jgi:hypothetical protein
MQRPTADVVGPHVRIVVPYTDREAAMVPIHNELAGGAPTGFAPHRNRDKILVSFTMTVVHGKRALG